MQKSELTLKKLLKGIKPKTEIFIFRRNDTEIDECLFSGIIDTLEYSVVSFFGNLPVQISAKDRYIRIEVQNDFRKLAN